MNLIDTHCHLDFERFDEDREAVIQRATDAGVTRIVVPGLDIASSRAAVELVDRYPGIYAAVGFHPNSIGPTPPDLDETLDTIRDLAQHDKVVAIGEIGLDYYWDTTPPNLQHDWLRAQLDLAADLSLPVILHNRDSTDDILEMLQQWIEDGNRAGSKSTGVMHSFSGDKHAAERTVEMGLHVGFTGPITFRKADETRRVAAQVPADRLLIETDAPFLTPHPYRGKRNEPAYVRYVAERLAEVRSISLEEMAGQTTRNARHLFRIPTEQD